MKTFFVKKNIQNKKRDTISPKLFTCLQEIFRELTGARRDSNCSLITIVFFNYQMIYFLVKPAGNCKIRQRNATKSLQVRLRMNRKKASHVQQMCSKWRNNHSKESTRKSKWTFILGPTITDNFLIRSTNKKTQTTKLKCFRKTR